MSPHGGKREGAGRKAPEVVRRPVQVFLSDEERDLIDAEAAADSRDRSTWMRLASVAKAKRRRR